MSQRKIISVKIVQQKYKGRFYEQKLEQEHIYSFCPDLGIYTFV